MAKRYLEETATAGAGSQDSPERPKKQKLKHSHSNGVEQPSSELTKTERKELKKLKKLKERKDSDQDATTTADPSKATTDTEISGAVEAQKAAEKAARKAEKKRLKALKNGVSEDSQQSDFLGQPTTDAEVSASKKLSKAERKAEKATKKALKIADAPESSASEIPAVNGHIHTAESEESLVSKADRKAEKKRLKAERKAREANGTSKDEPNGVSGHAASNGISNGQGNGVVNGTKPTYLEHVALAQTPQAEVDKFLSSNFISIQDPTAATTLRPIMSFSQLPSDAHPQPSPFTNFKSPTPIQAASWPFLLEGRDVVGVAETGSGKTLAFGVPCIRHISALPKTNKGSPARAVIVSPTRELAVQIHEQIVMIAKPAGLRTVCVYGGVPKEAQRADLKTAHIVVATPGRLNDLVEEGSANLSNVSYMVLDEADRMLDKGFEDAIRKIVSSTGPVASRQTLMFTATWPPSVRDLAATFMKKPVKISIGDNPTGELRANTKIKQTVEVVDPRGKEQRLIQLLKQYQSGAARNDRILVFCLYKKEATRIENFLRSKGLRVTGIHGDLSQEKRAASLESFKEGKTPLLVATDVAARGLDIPDVKLVINVTFPLTAEDYVHRIGRTGRAGADGHAITLFTEHDKAHSGALINVLKAAGQPVPDELLKFGTTVKKKTHDAYGAFYKDNADGKEATKIKFDD